MSLTFEGDGTISGFDAGLSGFGGLVAVHHVELDTVFSASLASGAFTIITGLSLTISASDASNKFLVLASVGNTANSVGDDRAAIQLFDGTSPFGIGAAAGSRMRASAGMAVGTSSGLTAISLYTPGDTSSRTFSVRLGNTSSSTRTVQVNRTQLNDADVVNSLRTASALTICELAV